MCFNVKLQIEKEAAAVGIGKKKVCCPFCWWRLARVCVSCMTHTNANENKENRNLEEVCHFYCLITWKKKIFVISLFQSVTKSCEFWHHFYSLA
jgi:hypothetical protein